ncbi:MAG: MFS transporter [Anaerolineae bacterium]|nr:MFS transporter [Anaerolineae bacterium]
MSHHLSRVTKFLYGIGDSGFSLTSTILGAYFAIFLTDVVGLSPGLAAIAIFVGRSWDYVNDPLIGHVTDRTRTRWGRRRPFLLFGSLPFALAFAMLWWRPPLATPAALAAYYAVAYVLFDAAATFVYMPYFALTPELTSDYDERTALTSYRMFFSILGSLIAVTVPLALVNGFIPEHASRVFTMGITFGIASAVPLLFTFFGTRERETFMEQEKPTLRESLRSAWKNKPFVYSLAIFLLTWITIDIVQAVLLYYVKYVVQREAQSDLIMASIFVTAIVALPFWAWLARRWGKRQTYAAGIAFWAVVQIVLITVNASTSLPVILLLCILAGLGIAVAHVLPWAIIPDAIEWGEWQTGERHEGMFYSLTTLISKVAASLAVPLVLLLMEATGYVPNAATQSTSALWGIRIVMGPIPAVLLCAGIVFALRYPLNRERFAQVVQELEARRAGQVAVRPDAPAELGFAVRPVRTPWERRIFLTFPWRIYRPRQGEHDPLWVPPLLPQRAGVIDPERGAFFEQGEAEFFIAWRDGEPVGTICAAEDRASNAFRGLHDCTFGFFECSDDFAVAEALFNQAIAWGRARGLDALCGPFNLDREDSYGVLVEGRDRRPTMLCGHTPPYYQDFLERFGFAPARADNLAFALDLQEDTPALQRLARLADRVRARSAIAIRTADLTQWDAELERIRQLLDAALAWSPDHTPWQPETVAALLEPFRELADPELVLFAEMDGKTMGFFPGIRDLNEAFAKANGLRYPWDYARLWWAMKQQPACLAIKSVLVDPAYWNTGVAVLLFDEMLQRGRARGFQWADLSLTSDDNPQTPILATRMGATLYKRYRVYRYTYGLEEAAPAA